MISLSSRPIREEEGARRSYAASCRHALTSYFYGLIGEGKLSDIMIWFLRNDSNMGPLP